MSRKIVLIGAIAFFVGIGTLVASFVAKPAQIIQGRKISKLYQLVLDSNLIFL